MKTRCIQIFFLLVTIVLTLTLTACEDWEILSRLSAFVTLAKSDKIPVEEVKADPNNGAEFESNNKKDPISDSSQLEAHVFEISRVEEINNCKGYYLPPSNNFEVYYFDHNELTVIRPSRNAPETDLYLYLEPGVYCREVKIGAECIEFINENSYTLAVYDENFTNCYKAVVNLVPTETTDNYYEIPLNENEVIDPPPESEPVPASESSDEDTLTEPPTSEEGAGTTGAHQFYSWYGSACDEMEGTYPYTWEVHLMVDSQTGATSGTVKFHNCPGGGRVLYTVTGTKTDDSLLVMQATKQNGGGTLYNDSPDSRTFNFDWASGRIVD